MILTPDQSLLLPCARCGKFPRQRVAPFWRSGVRAKNGARLTRGGKRITRGGKRIVVATGAAADCECCGPPPEPHDCYVCGNCCFSDISVVDVEYAITSTLSTRGDAAAGWETKSATLPFWSQPTGSPVHTIWHDGTGTPPGQDYNKLTVFRFCAGNNWSVQTREQDGPDPSVYEVDIDLRHPSFVQILGDCCGVDIADAYIRVWHYDAFGSNELGFIEGVGTLTITVTNNECCKEGVVCNEEFGNCDGSCLEPP